ncbi:uncharacterized protein [Setaria viridis]
MSLLTCRRIASTIFQTSCDFDAKPMVMLLGQYSTGKTTFIKHLLKTSYPGAHVGPEPTTDKFVVVMLMRVYGALMWSLGKVLNTPEVVRVYNGLSRKYDTTFWLVLRRGCKI